MGREELPACQTPGAIFHTTIRPAEVSVRVDLPHDVGLTEVEAEVLGGQLHDAVESVLAPLWRAHTADRVATAPSSLRHR